MFHVLFLIIGFAFAFNSGVTFSDNIRKMESGEVRPLTVILNTITNLMMIALYIFVIEYELTHIHETVVIKPHANVGFIFNGTVGRAV